ncbi:UDP-4-amino-4,6-dideoxy-N-acetyl-beta-L-altrosamine N-acetyltransferase [Helicobacter sp. MIT 11-5569]|uniref:UDP-4-amino-4, 6-dideoxy-N-acetyl-beta-L-altrosamine N-acetyltransferase n=1 Tax=Helicobacter sp. MIT 11-5569 TaxID=1548151 RepID=UPI0010FDF18B|nr:UDP-4-amino-4,6-dideoxy-N-acetyl-beta-L-altrosamine N-acetyltransferase [Helicobacter sp. MIT 11-5569]TLD83532.1 UDP-4-amino-4,6-dideoxy-N-acetyl-beta-L-altrosamine N-acetyltransferase [Helicobacter sp. MIT 11-5569]
MIEFKNFVDLNAVERVLVFAWRNHLHIAPLMKTQTIPLKEHLKFIESLKQDKSKRYFLVIDGDEVLGVVCFVDIKLGISCEFGIYQNPDLRGFGAKLMEAMLQYASEVLKVKILHACAFNHNKKAIALYTKFGFCLTKKDTTMSYFLLEISANTCDTNCKNTESQTAIPNNSAGGGGI